jgi:effector-binding domain-containing protein
MSCLRLAASIALLLWIAPALAQPVSPTPPAEPNAPMPLQSGDAFGVEVTLPERTMIYLKGHSSWDDAFGSLVDAFKSLKEYLDKQGIKPNGLAMTIYTKTDDAGFDFEAAMPVAEAPKDPPKGDLAVGPAPSGKMLKFVHRGSYDSMSTTYEAITNYLDDKQLEAKEAFIEEYASDLLTADQDNLVVNVLVPVK